MSFFVLWRCTALRCPSMPRGSAPIIPCGSAFRICLWQIHGSRRRAGARVRGGIFGSYGLGFFLIRDSGKRCASLSCLGLVSCGSACGFSIHLQCGFLLLLYSYICIGAPPLLYPAAPPSFSPPANDAIPLRLALLNACLAPCAGRAEPVYHIIDGTGKETVRK